MTDTEYEFSTLMHKVTFGLAVVGTIIFGLIFLAVLTGRQTIDDGLQRFAIHEVETRVIEFAENPPDEATQEEMSLRARLATRIAGAAEERFDLLTRISQNAEALVALALGPRCGAACEDVAETLPNRIGERILTTPIRDGVSLRDMIVIRYERALEGFLLEAKIFTGVNALLFALVLASAWFRRGHVRSLLKLEIAVLVTVAWTSWTFLAGKDWGMVLLTNDFMGWAYLTLAIIILLWLLDLLFLDGFITRTIIDLTVQAITHIFSNLPLPG